MTTAFFDLDHTLIDGDCDLLWIEFLAQRFVLDPKRYRREHEELVRQFGAGELDLEQYLTFSLRPLMRVSTKGLDDLKVEFMRTSVTPAIRKSARSLIATHRARGHKLVIITLTNELLAEPVAAELGVDDLIATELEIDKGKFTGRVIGTPCYREGKLHRLEQWLEKRGETLKGSWYYTDSHNDLPVLERVDNPVVVNPDADLRAIAQDRGWTIRENNRNSRRSGVAA